LETLAPPPLPESGSPPQRLFVLKILFSSLIWGGARRRPLDSFHFRGPAPPLVGFFALLIGGGKPPLGERWPGLPLLQRFMGSFFFVQRMRVCGEVLFLFCEFSAGGVFFFPKIPKVDPAWNLLERYFAPFL